MRIIWLIAGYFNAGIFGASASIIAGSTAGVGFAAGACFFMAAVCFILFVREAQK